jgi:hypothetical protein
VAELIYKDAENIAYEVRIFLCERVSYLKGINLLKMNYIALKCKLTLVVLKIFSRKTTTRRDLLLVDRENWMKI